MSHGVLGDALHIREDMGQDEHSEGTEEHGG